LLDRAVDADGWQRDIHQQSGFDPPGNVTSGSQLTAPKQYPFSHTYNLAGALSKMLPSSGRKLI
jgi:hypothetical protein